MAKNLPRNFRTDVCLLCQSALYRPFLRRKESPLFQRLLPFDAPEHVTTPDKGHPLPTGRRASCLGESGQRWRQRVEQKSWQLELARLAEEKMQPWESPFKAERPEDLSLGQLLYL